VTPPVADGGFPGGPGPVKLHDAGF
jgi:hypothetical protein